MRKVEVKYLSLFDDNKREERNEITKETYKLEQKLQEYLANDNLFVIFLKGQMYIEQMISEILKDFGKYKKKMDFHNKLKTMKKLDKLSTDIINALFEMKNVRNSLAHEFNRDISTDDINSIYAKLSSKNQKEVKNMFKDIQGEKEELINIFIFILKVLFKVKMSSKHN
ncbi:MULTISPECIES: DUF4145 domain-containing protein [Bacillus]|uniref:DUF4145 domain-containing protein n=1 Tax=Bacillus TaxID=1386 RepID=UPI000BEBD688|nr:MULTISPECIES: DUF4145 domain-containing protein [Bacillus]PED47354.1 hypothetical protein CON49_23940 [Bacillus cereus]PFI69580.1 hypothetical protein COI82_16315 [Bacillus cereus]PFO51517.1 hypothetical protein COJ74_27105 [Bacillus cereus]PFP65557.1 hypothetical protein COJ99_25660 [Bacillus cereus]PFQ17916.1 hypothetical protein COK13_25375 [Bacillus cereus]